MYTKALSENVCKAYQDKVPIVIYRPAIVVAKALPPLEGWTNNLNGPYGLSLAALLGVLRITYGDANTALDVIPVDVAVNGMIISACKRHLIDETTAVYNANFEKSAYCEISASVEAFEHLLPMTKSIWRRNVGCTKCKYNFQIQAILFHLLPAVVVDTVLKLLNKEPK